MGSITEILVRSVKVSSLTFKSKSLITRDTSWFCHTKSDPGYMMLDLKGDSAVWSQQIHGRSEKHDLPA